MSLNGDVLKVTNVSTGDVFIVPMYMVYHIRTALPYSKGKLSGRITEIKYAVDQTGSGDVTLSSIVAFNGSNTLYEVGHYGHDGQFCDHLSNRPA